MNNFVSIRDPSQFNQDFIKNYNGERDEGHFLEVDVEPLEKLQKLQSDLLFLPKRINIEKFEKLVANLHYKAEQVIHIINLNQALNHGSVLKKKFIECLKPYIVMNTDLKKNRNNELEKDFFRLMNYSSFWENC